MMDGSGIAGSSLLARRQRARLLAAPQRPLFHQQDEQETAERRHHSGKEHRGEGLAVNRTGAGIGETDGDAADRRDGADDGNADRRPERAQERERAGGDAEVL